MVLLVWMTIGTKRGIISGQLLTVHLSQYGVHSFVGIARVDLHRLYSLAGS